MAYGDDDVEKVKKKKQSRARTFLISFECPRSFVVARASGDLDTRLFS